MARSPDGPPSASSASASREAAERRPVVQHDAREVVEIGRPGARERPSERPREVDEGHLPYARTVNESTAMSQASSSAP